MSLAVMRATELCTTMAVVLSCSVQMCSCRSLSCLSSSYPSTGHCGQEGGEARVQALCKSHLTSHWAPSIQPYFHASLLQTATEAESRNHPHATKWPTNVFQGHAGVKAILSMACDLRKDLLCKEKALHTLHK